MKKSTKTGLGIVAAAALATTGAIVAFAIGSSNDSERVNLGCRGTYDLGNYVTFNSITDASCNVLGGEAGEKAFTAISEYGKNSWNDNTVVEDGKTYTLRMYVHNNSVSDENDDRVVDEGKENTVAKNTTVRVDAQRGDYEGHKNSFYLLGNIFADNAKPNRVYDHTYMYSANGEEFDFEYSNARYLSGNGQTFDLNGANLFSQNGVLVGYDKMDGNLPGCSKFSGWVFVDLTVNYKKPQIEISKAVKNLNVDGSKFAETTKAKSGDVLEYRVVAKNNGEAAAPVYLLDSFADGADKYVKYQAGSAKIFYAGNENGTAISDLFTQQTTELLTLAPGANFYITYKATVADGLDQLCQTTSVKNVITAFNKNGNGWTKTGEDDAVVTIDGKECHEGFKFDKYAQLASDDINDASTWHNDGSLRAKRGENVRFRIRFYNTGDTVLKNVKLRDPITGTGFVLDNTKTPYFVRVAGTAISAKTNVEDITNLIIDKVNPGEAIYFYLEAYVPTNDTKETLVCEDTQLTNVVYGSHENSDTELSTDETVIIVADDCNEDKKPGVKLEKFVQLKGGKTFATRVEAKAGDTVRYQLKFKNTGETTLEDYVLVDKLNENLTYVKGSTVVLRNGKEIKKSDGIVNEGIEIGDYEPGEEAIIYFYATVKTVLPDACKDTLIPNVATGYYNNDQTTRKTTNEADVFVTKIVCDAPELPKTGASSMLGLIVSMAGASTAAAYYIRSRKK